jgi:hypothetical protein
MTIFYCKNKFTFEIKLFATWLAASNFADQYPEEWEFVGELKLALEDPR